MRPRPRRLDYAVARLPSAAVIYLSAGSGLAREQIGNATGDAICRREEGRIKLVYVPARVPPPMAEEGRDRRLGQADIVGDARERMAQPVRSERLMDGSAARSAPKP